MCECMGMCTCVRSMAVLGSVLVCACVPEDGRVFGAAMCVCE